MVVRSSPIYKGWECLQVIFARCTMGNAGLDAVVARGLAALGADLAKRESILRENQVSYTARGATLMGIPPPQL